MPTKSFTYDGTPYSMYSRSEFTDDEAFNSLDQYMSTGKQSFDPSNEKSIMVQPGQVSSIGDMASHTRSMYDQYIAAPISQGIQSIQSNPTVQGIVGPGFTPPEGRNVQPDTGIETRMYPSENGSGVKAFGDYLKNTINDPVAMMLMLGGGPMGKATGSVMQKLAPTVLQGTLKAFGMPVGLASSSLALDQIFDPNASFMDSSKKAIAIGGVTTGLQYMMAGWNKFLSKQQGLEASQNATQSASRDAIGEQDEYNRMLQGFNDIWDKYGVTGSLQKNPSAFLKEMQDVAQKVGQDRLNTSIKGMLDYVKVSGGDDVKRNFASSIQSLRTNLTSLSNLQEGSSKYNDVFKDFIDNLHDTQNIVFGIKGKGYGITNPSDSVLSYQLSQDPEFIKALVNTKAISQGQAGAIIKNKGLEQILPDWKEYTTQRDIDRVVGRSNTNIQQNASLRNAQQQNNLDLPVWQSNMQSLVQEINNINRSKAVTESILGTDLKDVEAVKSAALKTLQKYDKIDATSQQIVNVASARWSRVAQDLEGRTLASTQRYGSKDYRDLTGFQLSTVGPFNSSVLQSLKEK